MAKVLGEAGRYASHEAARKYGRFVNLGFVGMGILGGAMGYLLCLWWQPGKLSSSVILVTELLLLSAIIFCNRFGLRKLGELDKERLTWRKGAVGEALIGFVLRDLPDDYLVINDLSTPYGNLDHVVVGPTGIFAIDTKNWKGIVTADGKGDVLLNNKAREKPTVKPIVGRTMGIRDAVIELCKNDPNTKSEMPYFRVVLAFPSAKVEARWGDTGSADCVSDEKLSEYIVYNRKGNTILRTQVESIAQAFLALATMDKGFKREPQGTDSKTSI